MSEVLPATDPPYGYKTTKSGRPTKLTPKLIKDVEEIVLKGNYVETACAMLGIVSSVWRDWLRKGTNLENKAPKELEKHEYLQRSFSMTVKRALAVKEANRLAIVDGASNKSWQAAAWALERMNPSKYGQRIQSNVSGDIKITIERKIIGNSEAGEVIDVTPNQGVIEE